MIADDTFLERTKSIDLKWNERVAESCITGQRNIGNEDVYGRCYKLLKMSIRVLLGSFAS